MRILSLLGFSILFSVILLLWPPQAPRADEPVPSQPAPQTVASTSTPTYWTDIKPIVDRRCVVCHGCFDAPCQFNMGSYEGLTRGATSEPVYNAARSRAAQPTRLFIDAQSTSGWRDLEFYPMLNEPAGTAEENLNSSVLYHLLALKQQESWPEGETLPDQQYDFTLGRKQECPRIDDIEKHKANFPQAGMPYGLPAIPDAEQATLVQWLAAGIPYTPSPPVDQAHQQQVAQWEAFLNGDSLKQLLMSRYIYEHWYQGHFYFDQLPGQQYFRLVRSSTPPGQPIQLIISRRPYDDPIVPRAYYRFRPVHETILEKTHMPFALNPARMQNIKAWFLDADYEVTQLPSYAREQASNPFITFREIPIESRYRFLLDEAQFYISGYIKGPVCRGQTALNVINDHFWVVFIAPSNESERTSEDFLAKSLTKLRLPAGEGSTANVLSWISYAKAHEEFLAAKSRYIEQELDQYQHRLQLGDLWDGEGRNENAALTIFRHFDSASVVKGYVGQSPQTVWVIDYSLLERIHYLLVAGFDVFGNLGHQLNTRLYMDFLRMEGEFNTLAFLPKEYRDGIRAYWYRGAPKRIDEYFNSRVAYVKQDTGIDFQTSDPFTEFTQMIRQHTAKVQSGRYNIKATDWDPQAQQWLQALNQLQGRNLALLPEQAFLTVIDDSGQAHHYSLISNSAHSNIAHLFAEKSRRRPEEDTLTLVEGFIGAHPNAFYVVPSSQLRAFVEQLMGLASEEDYRAFMATYGIRRTEPRFWTHSDQLIDAYRQWDPIESGIFDYNRYENR